LYSLIDAIILVRHCYLNLWAIGRKYCIPFFCFEIVIVVCSFTGISASAAPPPTTLAPVKVVSEPGSTMSTMKVDIEKFDGNINFSLWQVRMLAVLTQNGLKKALFGKSKKPATMSEDEWNEMDDKALTAIQLNLSNDVLQEVLSEKTSADLWVKLEELYLTKSLANRLVLKQRLFSLRMSEGTSIKAHISEFISLVNDLKNVDVKVEEEDQAMLLLCSLPSSFKHFRETIIYG